MALPPQPYQLRATVAGQPATYIQAPPDALKWGNSTQLAKEAVEGHLRAHEQYLSSQGHSRTGRVPSLVDLTAERLAFLDDATVDDIPAIILKSSIWRWHTLPYPTMLRALLRVCSEGLVPNYLAESVGPASNIDEWILSNEKWLQNVDQPQWHHGLVTLGDADVVFPSSILAPSGRIILRPGALPGCEILCQAREGMISIQPSVEAFKRTFERMSDGLLKNLDWSNLVVAGGLVLGALVSVDTPNGDPNAAERWKSSDIDVYVHGLSPREANEKIKHLFETFSANLPPGTPALVVRNSKTITFYARYPLRRIQIVLKLVKSPKAVLLNFDLDICAMGWDGEQVWMLPRAARALERCNVFTMNLIQGHYLSERRASQSQRIFKYADKGYGLRILPSYMTSLSRSATNIHGISGGESLSSMDMLSLTHEARNFTATTISRIRKRNRHWKCFKHSDLFRHEAAELHSTNSNCLAGFSSFMRHVALWEMGHQGEVTVTEETAASVSYDEDPEIRYDGNPYPQYEWDANFDIAKFQDHIILHNETEIRLWWRSDMHVQQRLYPQRLGPHGIITSDDLNKAQFMTSASSLPALLKPKYDIIIPLLLPCDFAVYANDLASRAQASAGLRETKLLMPAVPGYNFLGRSPVMEGLFYWRTGAELMWQQLDRRIDELFEVLLAFRKVNHRLHDSEDQQPAKLAAELDTRRADPTVEDEFEGFARWVGSRS